MKKWMKGLRWTVGLLGTLFFATVLVYGMPRAKKVMVTGTDVKRVDREKAQPGQSQTRDVRFIYTADIDGGKARAFRNEDNALYFKWSSGDLAAQAMSLAQEDAATAAGQPRTDVVLAKYYGLRVPLLDTYPNLLSLKKVPADYVYIPIFNIVFLVVLLALVLWAGLKIRKVFKKAGEKARELTRHE